MANTLTTAKTYYVRARHKATTGLTSDWSNPVKFTTAALTIDKPDFVVATKRAYIDTASYSIELKPFSATGGQILLSVDWQVSASATFSPLISEKISDTANTKKLPVAGLVPDTNTYVRYRYRSSANVVSEWSDSFNIQTAGYSVDPVTFVSTVQATAATYWNLEIRGGNASSGGVFAYTEWQFSTEPSFPDSYQFVSDAAGFLGTVTYKETNASSTNQNFVKHLSTKTFAYNRTYHIRARKAYNFPSGIIFGPWTRDGATILPTEAAIGVLTIPAANNSTVLRFNGMYTFSCGLPYSSNQGPALSLVSSDWEILSNFGQKIHSSTQPGNVLNIDGSVLVAGNTYQIRVRTNSKTGQLPQYPTGYPVTSPWSSYRPFMAIDKL